MADLRVEIKFLNYELSDILNEIKAQGSTKEKIESFNKDIIALLLSKVSEKLTQKKVSNYEVNECLKCVHRDLNELLQIKEDRALRREILDKFSENVEIIVRGQVMNSFTGLRNNFLGNLK